MNQLVLYPTDFKKNYKSLDLIDLIKCFYNKEEFKLHPSLFIGNDKFFLIHSFQHLKELLPDNHNLNVSINLDVPTTKLGVLTEPLNRISFQSFTKPKLLLSEYDSIYKFLCPYCNQLLFDSIKGTKLGWFKSAPYFPCYQQIQSRMHPDPFSIINCFKCGREFALKDVVYKNNETTFPLPFYSFIIYTGVESFTVFTKYIQFFNKQPFYVDSIDRIHP